MFTASAPGENFTNKFYEHLFVQKGIAHILCAHILGL